MPYSSNEKEATHEIIKDIEGITSKFNVLHKADIRNNVVPHLQQFLDTRKNNNQ